MRVNALLADTIESLHNGKLAALGIYLDRTITLGLPEDAPEPSRSNPTPLNISLAISMAVDETAQRAVSVGAVDPNQEPVFGSSVQTLNFERGKSVNLVMHFQPMMVTGLGEYQLVVTIDGEEHRTSFRVFRAGAVQAA